MIECYMCDKEGFTVEHVPPKCLFPEKKDLPDGSDFRKQLITVPACEEHNTNKSNDDEYLLYALSLNFPVNEVGKKLSLTKVMRAVERRPGLMKKILEDHRPVKVRDKNTNIPLETIAIKIDKERFNSSIEKIARAIHYYHFKEKWLATVSVYPDFFLVLDPKFADDNNRIAQSAKLIDELFKQIEYFGENPDVFKYQIHYDPNTNEKVIRLHFYNECRVTTILEL